MDECSTYIDEGTEWEVVEAGEAYDDRNSSARGASASAHFDIKFVWGIWKHTLCSFDYTRTAELARDSDGDDAVCKDKEEDYQKDTRVENS